MAYHSLNSFIKRLINENELITISKFADPELEIAEITDRVVKSYGKALLFTNNGTSFPLLINMFGSDRRMGLAFSRQNPYDAGAEIEELFRRLSSSEISFTSKLRSLPGLFGLSSLLPSRSNKKGACQEIIIREPDLGIFPILKCWPHDGGRYITLPIVHTIHPQTGSPNAGMYRMQICDSRTTGMHWQRHKTGAAHFEAWKKTGSRMPVSVTLGGDPVYTYAATAPLPENISEYLLAGFLRKKKVKLVKCITNDLLVPEDVDIVIEGYVDPLEEPFMEGPFGDHTGFYSLSDLYPRFHVTCITHQKEAVYPATIVGIPPMEDAWLAKATERIFLGPVRMALVPEVLDFHMPDAGTAHNLVVVRIKKSYPGQGIKVINSLFGAGQMMFSKYIIVVDGEVDIRNYAELAGNVFQHTDFQKDILFSRGPLDVLDHASDSFSFGGKAGIDATRKMPEELSGEGKDLNLSKGIPIIAVDEIIKSYNAGLVTAGI
ncbi:MAG TPA: menaquinone biosynthesis decarboxylase, partial [Bacteroidales bacterium]|nr:menaquinone biosynthesis decarboxylase [Bacteroidales bacterium]